MEIIIKNGLRVLTPNIGCRIVNKDKTQVYDSVLYLGNLDSIDNYIEMSIEEAEQLSKELEGKANEEYQNSK